MEVNIEMEDLAKTNESDDGLDAPLSDRKGLWVWFLSRFFSILQFLNHYLKPFNFPFPYSNANRKGQ